MERYEALKQNYDWRKTITKCLLDDGTLTIYDEAMDLDFSKEHPEKLEDLMQNPKRKYLGIGKIYSINGIEQKGFGEYHFFKYL